MTKLSLQKSILIRQIEMRIYVHNVNIFSNLKATAWAPVLEAQAPHKSRVQLFGSIIYLQIGLEVNVKLKIEIWIYDLFRHLRMKFVKSVKPRTWLRTETFMHTNLSLLNWFVANFLRQKTRGYFFRKNFIEKNRARNFTTTTLKSAYTAVLDMLQQGTTARNDFTWDTS